MIRDIGNSQQNLWLVELATDAALVLAAYMVVRVIGSLIQLLSLRWVRARVQLTSNWMAWLFAILVWMLSFRTGKT